MDNFFKSILDGLLTKSSNDIIHYATALITGMTPVVSLGLTIYVIVLYFQYQNAGLSFGLSDFIKKTSAWIIIISLGLNVASYQKIATTITNFPDDLAKTVLNAPLNASTLDTNYKKVDDSIKKLEKVGEKISNINLGDKLIVSGSVFIAKVSLGIILSAFVAFYALSKIMLLFLILLGPFFICCFIYPGLRSWGMSWIGHVLSHSFVILLLCVLNIIFLKFFMNFATGIVDQNWSFAKNIVMAPKVAGKFVFITVIFLIVMFNIFSLVRGLFNTASHSLHSHLFTR